MKRDTISEGMKSSRQHEISEAIVRERVQELIQHILEVDEVKTANSRLESLERKTA